MFEMAIQEPVGMQERLAASQEKVNQLTIEAENALEKYGEGSKQATRAEKVRDDAVRGMAYTQRNAKMAAGHASFFMLMIAQLFRNGFD